MSWILKSSEVGSNLNISELFGHEKMKAFREAAGPEEQLPQGLDSRVTSQL